MVLGYIGHGGANGGTPVSIGARLGGCAPIQSWRPTELSDQNAAEHGFRKWQVAKFTPPEDGGVGAFLVHDLQEEAAIQTYLELTPKSQLLFRVPGWDLGRGGRNLSFFDLALNIFGRIWFTSCTQKNSRLLALASRALSRSKVHEFVPHTQHVNLRIV